MRTRALGAALVLATSVAHAQSPETWLRKMHLATQKLSYVGTFVYQNADRTETSRITRFAAGDIEKLEVMNGVPREIVRTRDTVRCYLPDSRVVKVDRRVDRDFPGLLPEQINTLARHYDISLGETQRIAGLDCQTVVLQPKDNLRLTGDWQRNRLAALARVSRYGEYCFATNVAANDQTFSPEWVADPVLDARGETTVSLPDSGLAMVSPNGELELVAGSACPEPLRPTPLGPHRIVLACRSGLVFAFSDRAS